MGIGSAMAMVRWDIHFGSLPRSSVTGYLNGMPLICSEMTSLRALLSRHVSCISASAGVEKTSSSYSISILSL